MAGRRHVVAILAALSIAAGAGLPCRAGEKEERAGTKAEEAAPDGSPRSPRGVVVLVPGWTPPEGAGDYPEGVTVLGPGPAAGPHASDYPPGVTLLDERTRDDAAPIVRIEIDEPTGQVLVVVTDPPEEAAPAEAAGEDDEDEAPDVSGPTPSAVVAAFGGARTEAAGAVPKIAAWIPVSALEPRDPEAPYPWNPATWSETFIDAEWLPVAAWPARDPERPYPWNPAGWAVAIVDPEWLPEDAWGRVLGLTFVDGVPAGGLTPEQLTNATSEGEPAGAQPPAEAAPEGP